MENETPCGLQSAESENPGKAGRLQKWQQELEAHQRSGLTVREWCEARGTSPSAFYRRQRRVRAASCEEPTDGLQPGEGLPAVVPVGTVCRAGAEIRIASSGIDISISGDISAENLRAIIQSLKPC